VPSQVREGEEDTMQSLFLGFSISFSGTWGKQISLATRLKLNSLFITITPHFFCF